MTRRIAISILVTVWLVLILAGALAYGVTRSLLVADLDQTLLARVASLPEIERSSALPHIAAVDERDRYVVHDPQGNVVRAPSGAAAAGTADIPAPQIVAAKFLPLPGGRWVRTITVRAFARRAKPSDPLIPVTVVYSGPADQLDALLSRLLLSLGAFGLAAGLLTAWVAVIAARAALKPLRGTAEVIAAISERNLHSRIAVEKLPAELLPVGLRLNELLARLEAAFAQRKRFLADASHELRTPVAALVTALEVTLIRGRSPEDYVRALESCLADARVLHQLIAALLDQVRSEQFAPGAAAEAAPVRIGALLGHCAKIAATLAAPRKIHIDVEVFDDPIALSDELKLRSMVTNLLGNAVEYTAPGGRVALSMEVDSSATVAEDSGAMRPGEAPDGVESVPRLVRIVVADNGPGIGAAHLAHVFEPFYRADSSRSQAQHHLGLGLFLVRSHARSLGGDCKVESAPGSGSRFILELPMRVLAAGPADASDAPQPREAGAL